MKFTSPFAALLFLAYASASTINVESRAVSIPALKAPGGHSGAILGLLATTEFQMCSQTNFQSCITETGVTTGTCYVVREPFITSLFSAKARSGFVCFMYRGNNCDGGCEVCVDAAGWPNMSSIDTVLSYKCVAADSAGCSDSSCENK